MHSWLLNKENFDETEAEAMSGGEVEIMMLPQDNGGSGQLSKTCVGPYNVHSERNKIKNLTI